MKKEILERFKIMANIFKAMNHPARLFIVESLKNKEYNVSELTELIGDDISTVSRHLKVLKDTGIIEDEKRGNQVYYKLVLKCIPVAVACVREYFE